MKKKQKNEIKKIKINEKNIKTKNKKTHRLLTFRPFQ